jgi:hypothetical protein
MPWPLLAADESISFLPACSTIISISYESHKCCSGLRSIDAAVATLSLPSPPLPSPPRPRNIAAQLAPRLMAARTRYLIIDAGSGYSRAQLYHGTTPIRTTTKLAGPAFASMIRSNDYETFLKEVKKLLPPDDTSDTSVFIGATAGVRSALDDGTIRPVELDDFTSLASSSSYNFSFALLSGEQEAKYEHASALSLCRSLDILTSSDENLGLISSGGMSSQFVYPSAISKELISLSLPTNLKSQSNEKCLELGVKAGLASYAEHMATAAVSSVKSSDPIEPCLFVLIEMLGGLGEKMNIHGVRMSVSDAQSKIEAYLEEVVVADCLEKEAGLKEGGEEMSWKDYVHGGSCVQALELLKLLDDGCEVYFCRTFSGSEEEGEAREGGGGVKASWGHGYVCAMAAEDN